MVLHATKQETRSAVVGSVSLFFKESSSVPEPNLLRCKSIIYIAKFSVRTLNTVDQQHKIIHVQKHKFHHSERELEKYHGTSYRWAFTSISKQKKIPSMQPLMGLECIIVFMP